MLPWSRRKEAVSAAPLRFAFRAGAKKKDPCEADGRRAPCGLPARGRNQARDSRRRVTRADGRAREPRETGFRRTEQAGGGVGGTEGSRSRMPANAASAGRTRPRSTLSPTRCRPAPSRAQAQSGARTAPPRNARGQARTRYARNRVPPHGGGRGRSGRNAREPKPDAGERSFGRVNPPPHPLRAPSATCALARAGAQSGARTAPPRNARADGRARYARNRVPPHGASRRRSGRNGREPKPDAGEHSAGRANPAPQPPPPPRPAGGLRSRQACALRAKQGSAARRRPAAGRTQRNAGERSLAGREPPASTRPRQRRGRKTGRRPAPCPDRRRPMKAAHEDHDTT